MSLLQDLKDVVSVKADLARCATALERIAAAQEMLVGTATPVDLPEAEADPPVAVREPYSDAYYATLDALRGWFIRENHREPTPEELMAEFDGLPPDPIDLASLIKKRGMDRG